MSIKWIRSSLFVARTMSATLATATMVFAPVAQGAGAEKELENAAKLPATQSREIASVKSGQNAELAKAMESMVVTKEGVQEYFKLTGLGGKKPVTVGEFYSKFRNRLPDTLRRDMDKWATLNHNALMPKAQVSTYKGSDGSEQVRLIFAGPSKKSVTVSFDSKSEKKFLKYNNVNLSKKDLLFHEQALRKIGTYDKDANAAIKKGGVNRFTAPVTLSYEEYVRYTPRQRAEFLVQLRYLAEAAAKALKAFPQNASLDEENYIRLQILELFLLQTAEAATVRGASTNDPCVVNAFFSSYSGKDVTCAGGPTGRERLGKFIDPKDRAACGEKSEPCMPLVYGYNNNGKPYCVGRSYSANRDATSTHCPGFSKLRNRTSEEIARGDKTRMQEEIEDKKRIIESWMKNKGEAIDLNFDPENGKLAKDQYDKVISYVDELNKHIEYVVNQCGTEKMMKVRTARPDQEDACKAIALRKINIDFIAVDEPVPNVVLVTGQRPVAAPGTPEECDVKKPGSTGPNCEKCKSGLVDNPEDNICDPAMGVVPGVPPRMCEDGKTQPDKNGNCPAGSLFGTKEKIALGVVGAVLLCAFFCKGKDKKPNTVPPKPYDPCPPAPMLCTPGGPSQPPTTPVTMPPPIIENVPAPVPPVPPGTPETPPPVAPPAPVDPPPTVVIPEPVPDQPETTNNPSNSTAAGIRPGNR